jgi:hypothetical protein
MMVVDIQKQTGDFCENKDIARGIRIKNIMPALASNQSVTLDFRGVHGATQSFIHALIVEPIREFKSAFFNLVSFKNCEDAVKTIIGIVSEYTQESMYDSRD